MILAPSSGASGSSRLLVPGGRGGRGGGCGGVVDILIPLCVCVPESRSERTKRLFRHYTVGSYDSFDAPR